MLYHKDVFWNKKFDVEAIELIKSVERTTRHLQDRIDSGNANRAFNTSGVLKAVDNLKTKKSISCFEVETDNNKVVKCCVRTPYNAQKDICLVIRQGVVITAWLCNRNDTHKTLDRSKYAKR